MAKLAIKSQNPLTNRPVKERGYPNGYTPTDKEDYMNAKQLAYFRDLLLTWRQELEAGNLETVADLREHSSIEADLADQATIEYEQTLELRNRDRARKLISKIDEALDRIRDGSFGYCEETGDPIGIGRLLARPIATLSIEAKRRQEKKEISYAG
jgi:DnaK suppressor protein